MTKSQKLALRASEIRTRLAAIADLEGDALTDEIRAEVGTLRNEMQDVEIRYQAAVEGEGEPETRAADTTGEGTEIRELRDKVQMANYLTAAVEQRAAHGPEAELNAALGMSGNQFPLELLAPEEHRQTTNTESSVAQQTWLDRLFADTAAMRLGITMRSVGAGVQSVPMTTAGADFAMKEREAAIGDAAWTVGVTESKPKRGGVRAKFTAEDAARLPGLESALRRDLAMALTQGVDLAMFTGADGGAGNTADITGLTTAGIAEVGLKQADKVKGPETLAAFINLIDGVHAGGAGDLRIVTALGAYRLWATTITNAAAENQTVMQFLAASGVNYSTRGGIETATGNGKFGAFIGLGRGIEGAAVANVWSAGTLIVDPYTNAAEGETALTLSYLWDFVIPRPASYKRLKFVT